MRITAIIVALALALAGCGLVTSYQIANMTPDQLTKLSDYDLCWHGSPNSPAVMAERQKRDLADCSPAAQQCHAQGYRTGTELYLKCRQIQATLEAQQAAAQQAAGAAMVRQGAAMMTPAPVTTTNCNTFGNTLNCTSSQH
jgi:cytochrome c